jgi:hypothetical protein
VSDCLPIRKEIRAGFADLRTEMRELRGEMHGGCAEIVGVHRQLVLALTAGVGLLGLLGAQTV